jgi:cytochrome c
VLTVHSSTTMGLLFAVGILTVSCGNSEPEASAEGETPRVVERTAPLATLDGPVDGAAADRGAALFTERACQACHTIGAGRLVGPDLAGVTTRREAPWILAMITTPDSMVRADPIAKQLFAEYMTPMANQNVSIGDAQAILQFLRRSDGLD